MAIVVTKVVVEDDPQHGSVLYLYYRLPGESVPHTDPVQAAQGKTMNDDPTYGGHQHAVPVAAIYNRMALYGYTDPLDALEECIHEIVSKPWRSLNVPPSKADLRASRGRNPVSGLKGKLASAGITIPPPAEEDVVNMEAFFLVAHGREGLARIRGVAASSLPDPKKWDPRNQKPLDKRLPTGAP